MIADFKDHLNGVLAKTITPAPLVQVRVAGSPMFQLAFRQRGRPCEIELRTRYGAVSLYLGQTCRTVREGRRDHRLQTVAYQYTLRPGGATDPLVRWEYAKEFRDHHCRHHVQGPVDVAIGESTISLNDVHLPTGYVTIEEVVRFCLDDLGAAPLSENWHRDLEDSYQNFKTKFAPRG